MNTPLLLQSLATRGVTVRADGPELVVKPASLLTTTDMESLRQHKAELLDYLRQPPREYGLVYPTEDSASGYELREIERRVEHEGVVLLYSNVLDDLVAFYKSEADRKKIAPGFVPYSDGELRELFGGTGSAPSASHLRLIHQAKKTGASIIPNPDGRQHGPE